VNSAATRERSTGGASERDVAARPSMHEPEPGVSSVRYPVGVPMDRDSLLLLALGSLVVAALTVGASGWILVLRERRLATGSPAGRHHGAPEEE
jgi:hypothetical protein